MSMEEQEGWERSELLPQGWMFKVIWEGFVKDKEWTQTVRYLSRESGTFDSMKGVIDYLTSCESDYSESDVQRCKEFLVEQKAPEKKYNWSDGGDSLPAGWKSRVSEGEAKMEWILSPEGRMYRTRYVAVLDMVKKEYSEERVEEMKRSMEEHEGWERSELLPQGRMYRTRYVAVLDMVKKEYSEERVEEMKRSMEEHEGWER